MLIVQAEKIVSDGSCLSHIDGKAIFIPFALPNETIEIEIVERKKNYERAKITKLLSPSPFRIEPACAYYKICGGCNMMHASYEAQKNFRTEIIRDVFLQKKIALQKIDCLCDEQFFYRARFTLHDGSLFQKKAHTKIPITQCVCATAEINSWLKKTPIEKRPKGELRIFGDKTLQRFPNNIAVSEIKNSFSNQSEKTIASILLLNKNIFFNINNFFQSNIRVLEKLILLLQKKLHGKHLLDMYAGVGTFSIFLQNNFEKFTLVEENKNACVFAKKNLQNVSHTIFSVKGSAWVKLQSEKNFDCAIVDPPRTGMEKAVCAYFAKSKIKTICSISCDIATHARDICLLIKAGYTIDAFYLLDFYPNTNRIESLALLSYKN